MPSFPLIDYVGAAQGIVNAWSDIPRVDREREDTAMRRELQNKQMTLYALQTKKAQMEMEEAERNQLFKKNLGADLLLQEELGNFNPTIGQTTVPGEPKTLYSLNAPKANRHNIISKQLLTDGRIEEYLKFQEEATKVEKDKEADFMSKVKEIREWAERFPSVATAMAKTYAAKDKRFEVFSEFNYDMEGKIENPVKDPTTGKVDGRFILGPDRKWHYQKKEEERSKTPYELAKADLALQLKREPNDSEIRKSMADESVRIAGAKAEATEKGKQAGGFLEWTPQAKQQAFMYNLITKEPPVSTKGMASGDRKVYAKEFTQWQVDNGFKPGDIALMQADYKAGDMSLKNMTKQEAPMSAFVGNINKQIDKVEQLYSNNDRTGLRLLDKPIRDLRVSARGSGDEAVKASYLLEISNEIGKLSSGASGSVQQLSDSAKEDWKKVHDPNLSLSEIMKVVNATREQANMRLASWRDAKEEVRSMMGGLGNKEPGPSAGGENNPGNIMKPGGEKSGRRNYGNPEEGLIAIPHLLLTDRNYKGKTVDEAMKTYSNSGYGGEIVPEIKNKPLTSLTTPEMTKLTVAIIKREGNTKAQSSMPGTWEALKKKKGW